MNEQQREDLKKIKDELRTFETHFPNMKSQVNVIRRDYESHLKSLRYQSDETVQKEIRAYRRLVQGLYDLAFFKNGKRNGQGG